jgi:hypothetical protein
MDAACYSEFEAKKRQNPYDGVTATSSVRSNAVMPKSSTNQFRKNGPFCILKSFYTLKVQEQPPAVYGPWRGAKE